MPELFEPASPAAVVVLHLGSGEEIIGKTTPLTHEDDPTLIVAYKVDYPLMPLTIPDHAKPGNFTIRLVPIRPYIVTDSITVERFHVAFVAPVSKDMVQLYQRSTSNIEVVGADAMPTEPPTSKILL